MTGRSPTGAERSIRRASGNCPACWDGEGYPQDVPTDDGVRRMNAAVREEVCATGSSDDIQGLGHILERLVPAAFAGNEEARERLLAEIQPLVQRYCRGRLGRSEGVIGSAPHGAPDARPAGVRPPPAQHNTRSS